MHEPRGLREAIVGAILRKMLQRLLKPVFSPRFSIGTQRRWLERLSALSIPPRGVAIEPGTVAGVPGEWLRARDGTPTRGTFLYLHGGAYCVGSPRTHRPLTGRLAKLTGLPVYSADYRLAPEHPFPAAVDDAVAIVRELHAQGLGPVLIGGDSAGGGLALLTAQALRDAGETMPTALVLLSPWVDLTPDGAPTRPVPGEAMLTRAWGEACAHHFLADADPLRASPLRADLRGLPPTLVQFGTDEMLHDQAVALHDALDAAGVAVRGECTPRRWHVHALHAGSLPSADESIDRIAGFVGQVLPVPAEVQRHEVVVLGAGMSGLCTAVQLKRAGLHDIVVIEKSAGIGGTWWDNRYPGAHVDVPAPLYSYSFAPNPRWKQRFAAAAEIQAYMVSVADRYRLHRHLRFGRAITEARHDAASGLWSIRTDRGDRLEARFLVCSTGLLSQPRWPELPGLECFEGQRLHSARWDPAVPLAGRHVGVIGTGSTAAQLVPEIAREAGHLALFQRTANWVLPRLDRRYTALDQLLAQLPPYARLVRAAWCALLEWGRHGFDEGTLARRRMLAMAGRHLGHAVKDPALRERLTPPYPLGCKRIIYSNDYYPALVRPNVALVTDAIAEVTPHGVRTADGREHPLDVLVCATGFDTAHMLSSVAVHGLGGRRLSEAWARGPEAYRGVTVAGFPNLFLTLGPNTGTGHTSTLLYIEPQVRFIVEAIRRVQAQGARSIAVRDEVHAAHNAALQARLQGTVWHQCRSWYRMSAPRPAEPAAPRGGSNTVAEPPVLESAEGGGKIIALWPGYTREYVQGLARVNWDDYRIA
ncbi:MAG: FAD-dependent oxidoreductase [Rubrivivax sp.]|nr:FAD-dependent oxidoreductase [Rubrivivax sp.]